MMLRKNSVQVSKGKKMTDKILATKYKLHGLPSSWIGRNFKNCKVSELKTDRIKTAFQKIPEAPLTILVTGQVAPVVDMLIDLHGLKEVQGVDYSKYFVDAVQGNNPTVTAKQYTVIYNVGLEPIGSNYTYSSSLLKNLVQGLRDGGNYVIIHTHNTANTFKRNYEMEVTNHINIEEVQDEKFI